MSFVSQILRCVGLLPRYTDDDVLNAETENDLYDHRKALEKAQTAIANRENPDRQLHDVLEKSRVRSQEFIAFEELIRKEADRVRNSQQ